MIIFTTIVIIFAGLALTFNSIDYTHGTRYAFWFNYIGWSCVPFAILGLFVWYCKVYVKPYKNQNTTAELRKCDVENENL
ncbi:MAG: hypothetical protein AMJ90_06885 [candidate division Zixibacteria bacterium SM23_73_2]|nr:MAG: hypothetical protein AMJ90_06885 [candidate division Zixibacteria bacterium SM23_73_2]